MKNCNKIKTVSKRKGPFKFSKLVDWWNLKHNGERKQEDWTNLETIEKNQKLQNNLQK